MSYARRPNPVFSEDYRALIEVLVATRRRYGVTQRLLAERLGKAHSHVSMIERGQRRLDTLEAFRIAQCLGVRPLELFAEMEARLESLTNPQTIARAAE